MATIPSAQIAAAGLKIAKVLRENAGVCALVSKDMQAIPAGKGETVSVGMTAPMTADDLTPAASPTFPTAHVWKNVDVSLSAWKKAEFYLTSRERAKIVESDWVPKQLTEAVKAVVKPIKTAIYAALYKGNGIKRTTQTSNTFNATDKLANLTALRTKLTAMGCPDNGQRKLILSADAEEAALNLDQFTNWAAVGKPQEDAYKYGLLGKVMNFDIYGESSADLPKTCTPGTDDGAYELEGAHAIGATSLTLAEGTGTILAGSLVTIGNFTYCVKTGITEPGTLVIHEPGLLEAFTGEDDVVSVAAHHIDGYAFDPDGIMLVGRITKDEGALGQHQVITDPVTGLLLKVSVIPCDEAVMWRVSSLYGADIVDPRLICRAAHATS